MVEEPAGSPESRSAPPPPRQAWVVVLEVLVAAVIGVVLIAGPQIWTVGDWLKQFRQPSTTAPAAAPHKPAASKSQPAVPASAIKVQPPAPAAVSSVRPGAQPQASVTPARPAANPPRPQPRRAATPRTAHAPILNEPKSDPRQYHDTLMRQGIDLYQGGWYGPALGRFRLAATVMPSSASAHLWIGRGAIRVGRYAEAQRALQRVISLAPSSDAARQARVLLDELRL